jgi:putative glutamine amidotransferase
MRALIAVAGQHIPAGNVTSWREDSVAVPANYIRALRRAGGQEAVLFPETVDAGEARERLARFDGVLLIGGADVDPSFYGEDRHPEVYGVNRQTDQFEISLARAAVEEGKPMLAICRGIQVLNVALGGSLDQHITGREGLVGHGIPGVAPEMHDVRLETGSRVAKAMGVEETTVSSSHHQALARLAEDLRPVGWTADGIVEAVEHQHGWVLGVEWHPERTAAQDRSQQGLFDALVVQASGGPGG